MLMSILFDEMGHVLAGAPACDQQPLGMRYWNEVLGVAIDAHTSYETGLISIRNSMLIDALSSFHLSPDLEQRVWIESQLDQLMVSVSRPSLKLPRAA